MKKKLIYLLNLLITFKGISMLFIGLPISILIRIISPIILIRIMHINSSRIGEFILNYSRLILRFFNPSILKLT